MSNEDLVVVGSKSGWPTGKVWLEEPGCLSAWKEEGYPEVRDDTSVFSHGREGRHPN